MSVAPVLGFASLLKKPPGIFPAAYIFSEYSTINGKKSIPGLGSLEAVTAASITVLPQRRTTDPFACFAMLPEVNSISRDPIISLLDFGLFNIGIVLSSASLMRDVLLKNFFRSEMGLVLCS